jgi:hypothetical protein
VHGELLRASFCRHCQRLHSWDEGGGLDAALSEAGAAALDEFFWQVLRGSATETPQPERDR